MMCFTRKRTLQVQLSHYGLREHCTSTRKRFGIFIVFAFCIAGGAVKLPPGDKVKVLASDHSRSLASGVLGSNHRRWLPGKGLSGQAHPA